MITAYKVRRDNLKCEYKIDFVTTNYNYFKLVEEVCQKVRAYQLADDELEYKKRRAKNANYNV